MINDSDLYEESKDGEMVNDSDLYEESKDGFQLSDSELMKLGILTSDTNNTSENVIAEEQRKLLVQI